MNSSFAKSIWLIFSSKNSNTDTNPDFKKINNEMKNEIGNQNEFAKICINLYTSMDNYAVARANKRSKFPTWFNDIKQYEPTDYFSSLLFLNAIIENGIPSSSSIWNSKRRKEICDICAKIRKQSSDTQGKSGSLFDAFLRRLEGILTNAIENPKENSTNMENDNASGHSLTIAKPNIEMNMLIQDFEKKVWEQFERSAFSSLVKILKKIIEKNTSSDSIIKELTQFDDSLELTNLDKNDVFGQIKENIIEIYESSDQKSPKMEAKYDDFNFDNIGVMGKLRRWSRCSKEWDLFKKCVVKDISSINSVDAMLPKLEIAGWTRKVKDKLDGTEEFNEAAASIIGAYATFVQNAFKQIRKSGKKLSKLNMTNPSKITKSKKMKMISLLLNYIFRNVMKIDYKEINVIYAGTHGVFVEVLNSTTPGGDDNPVVEARYFKLSDLDKEVDVDDFVRDTSNENNDQLDVKKRVRQILSHHVRNLSLYKKVTRAKQKDKEFSKSGILEVENQKAIPIHSIRHLIKIEKDVCDCLMDLHDYGLVHGDIKEDNIIITRDGAKVIDVDGIRFEGLNEGSGSWENRPVANVIGFLNPLHFGKVYDDQFKDLCSFGVMIKRQIKSFLKKNKNFDSNDDRLQDLKKIANLCIHPRNITKEQTKLVQDKPRQSYAHLIKSELDKIK